MCSDVSRAVFYYSVLAMTYKPCELGCWCLDWGAVVRIGLLISGWVAGVWLWSLVFGLGYWCLDWVNCWCLDWVNCWCLDWVAGVWIGLLLSELSCWCPEWNAGVWIGLLVSGWSC